MKQFGPETQEARLPSAGYNFSRATRHIYSHSVFVQVPIKNEMSPGLAHMFKCTETGMLRRWGIENAPSYMVTRAAGD